MLGAAPLGYVKWGSNSAASRYGIITSILALDYSTASLSSLGWVRLPLELLMFHLQYVELIFGL